MVQKYNISIDNENFFQKIYIVNRKSIKTMENSRKIPAFLFGNDWTDGVIAYQREIVFE